jgi:RES domain-containing protein
MQVWRLSSARYATQALSGLGGIYSARRWNEKGHLIVYGATSPALAAIEYFVNLEPNQAPDDLVMLEARVPDENIQQLDLDSLPPNWYEIDNLDCRAVGTEWLQSRRSVALKVPSVPVRGDWNILLNPAHPDFRSISITSRDPFFYDERMFKPRGRR